MMTTEQVERALRVGERIAAALEAIAGTQPTPSLEPRTLDNLAAPMAGTARAPSFRTYHALMAGPNGTVNSKCAASSCGGKVSMAEAVLAVMAPTLCSATGCRSAFTAMCVDRRTSTPQPTEWPRPEAVRRCHEQ